MYGIDRASVDAEFEIENWGRTSANSRRSELRTALDSRALFDRNLGEVAVERERLTAVIDDHQPAVAGERVGKGDHSFVHGLHHRSVLRRNLNTAQWRPTGAGVSERSKEGTCDRPVHRSFERCQRERADNAA